jgi:hypothetical protein
LPRTFVTFDAPTSCSDPPGAELADGLRQRLGNSFSVSERFMRSGYGWEFVVSRGRDRFIVVPQLSDAWLVIVAPLKRFLGLGGAPSEAALLVIVRAIHEILPSVGASSIGWFTRRGFEAGAAAAPSPEDAAT